MVRPQAPQQPAPQPNPPLSPIQASTPLHTTGRTSFSAPHPFSTTGGTEKGYTDPSVAKYNTAPNGYGAGYSKGATDEFGGLGGVNTAQTQTLGVSSPIVQSPKSYEPPAPTSPTTGAIPRGTQSGRGSAPSGNRLTVANFGDDMPEEAAAQAASIAAARTHTRQTSLTTRNPSAGGSQPTKSKSNTNVGGGAGWMSAEEEKRKLYDRAVASVERVQGVGPTPASPSSQVCLDLSHVMDFTEGDALGFFDSLSHPPRNRPRPRGAMDLRFSLVPQRRGRHGHPPRKRNFVSTTKLNLRPTEFTVSMRQAAQEWHGTRPRVDRHRTSQQVQHFTPRQCHLSIEMSVRKHRHPHHGTLHHLPTSTLQRTKRRLHLGGTMKLRLLLIGVTERVMVTRHHLQLLPSRTMLCMVHTRARRHLHLLIYHHRSRHRRHKHLVGQTPTTSLRRRN